MSDPEITGVMPFFIVTDFARSVAFYCDQLGFQTTFSEPDPDPFFAIVTRGAASLMLKEVGASPVPNASVHEDARLDAFFSAADPDTLAAELSARDVSFSKPLGDTHDGLRGFEVRDPDGHVLFFGRPK